MAGSPRIHNEFGRGWRAHISDGNLARRVVPPSYPICLSVRRQSAPTPRETRRHVDACRASTI